MTEPKIMGRIMALLAKAEASEHEQEAATYLAKAQELMIKHAVLQSDLTPEQREKITAERVPMGSARPDQVLLNAVARAAECRTVLHRHRGYGVTAMTIIGYPTDIAYVQALFASLVLQREGALRRSRGERPEWESPRSFNHSFRLGYADRIEDRLAQARQVTVARSGPGAEVVLFDKGIQAELHLAELFPRLNAAARVRTSSAHGGAAGARAADGADISGGRHNLAGRRALG